MCGTAILGSAQVVVRETAILGSAQVVVCETLGL